MNMTPPPPPPPHQPSDPEIPQTEEKKFRESGYTRLTSTRVVTNIPEMKIRETLYSSMMVNLSIS
jgi:hypothetical protein